MLLPLDPDLHNAVRDHLLEVLVHGMLIASDIRPDLSLAGTIGTP